MRLSALLVTALAFTPNDGDVLFATQAGVRLRTADSRSREAVATKLAQVHALVFTPDGKTLAVAGGSPAESGAVELWSWREGKLVTTLAGHDDLVYAVAWGPKGEWLAAAGADRDVRVWDVATGRRRHLLSGHSGPVLALAATPDGRWLFSAGADQTIRVWDAATGRAVRTLDNHTGTVHGLALRPGTDGPPVLASAGADGTIRVWQPTVGRMVRIVRHPAVVYAVAWSGDGAAILSGAGDGKLRLIAADSDTVLAERAIKGGRPTVVATTGARGVAGTTAGETIRFDVKAAAFQEVAAPPR